MNTLIIGDPHCDSKRPEAWKVGTASIFRFLEKSPNKFSRCIITGDMYNKAPAIADRILFAQFIKKLNKHVEEIIFIKGTDTHEYSQGNYNLEDWCLLLGIKAVEEFSIGAYVFGHYEVKGTKYITGFVSTSEREVDPDRTYLLGHIHSPECSFKNVCYVGSIYKTSFAERFDQKRIATIIEGKLNFHNIKSLPMIQLNFEGKKGSVKVKTTQLWNILKEWDKEAPIDIKINAEVDSVTAPSLNRIIIQIKKKYNIEYYQQDISITELKTDIPKNLDRTELLKKYCKQKNTDFSLVEKEL